MPGAALQQELIAGPGLQNSSNGSRSTGSLMKPLLQLLAAHASGTQQLYNCNHFLSTQTSRQAWYVSNACLDVHPWHRLAQLRQHLFDPGALGLACGNAYLQTVLYHLRPAALASIS